MGGNLHVSNLWEISFFFIGLFTQALEKNTQKKITLEYSRSHKG